MVSIQTEELLSTATAAARLKISTRRVLQLIDEGRLTAFEVDCPTPGRAGFHVFRSEDIAAYRTRKQTAA